MHHPTAGLIVRRRPELDEMGDTTCSLLERQPELSTQPKFAFDLRDDDTFVEMAAFRIAFRLRPTRMLSGIVSENSGV